MNDARPRALLLDLDGTLADSLPVMRAAYDAFLAEHRKRGDDAEFEALNGPALPEIVARLRDRHGLEPELGPLEQRYRALIAERYAAEARPAAGAVELLAASAQRDIAVWVVTAAEREIAEAFVAAHGLGKWIAGIVTAEGLPRAKPDPAVYLRALALAGVRPDEAWAVEDSANGWRSATAAGIPTFLLAQAASGAAPVAASRRIASLAELVPLLPDCSVEPLTAPMRIVRAPARAITDEEARRIDAIWTEELRARPGLFDGMLLVWAGRDGDTLRGALVPYRRYIAQRRDPTLRLGLVPLAVSGLVLCAGSVAFARRSERTTQYPGRLELVPSGGLDAQAVRDDGSVDHRAQLVRELLEETGIAESLILKIEPVAIVRDHVDQTVDVASIIEVAPAARAVADAALADGGGEYRSLVWVPVAGLSTFLDAHRHEMVPPSRALAALFAARR